MAVAAMTKLLGEETAHLQTHEESEIETMRETGNPTEGLTTDERKEVRDTLDKMMQSVISVTEYYYTGALARSLNLRKEGQEEDHQRKENIKGELNAEEIAENKRQPRDRMKKREKAKK